MESTANKKGRMSAVERDFKKSQGKELFVKGFSITNISEIIGVGIKTLSGWRDDDDWDKEKELHNIKPSEIKRLILAYVRDIKNGETPLYKADDLAKISAAFDRLNDSRKKAVHTMESFDGFSSFMMLKAGNATGKKREELLETLKSVRVFFDLYVNELLQHD
ncbi:hypothetical protein R1T16_17445 [Flavobacterium sp. DG1-102-2]|uniref:terminase gpP N-terminus-related DNA-binding protein n=1 Tax=Flavobacterium sp. DG1-102-2 TaxID=3081663 RepID=UPI00294A2F48|nr:hypothetical protein [Flavobacterium sp. DG1-102-2]MDV6170225.1 hypothetical protein [Flavobacterium sp. DG1-102-2]